MTNENDYILNTKSVLKNLANTLLYEGYSLFPYHRSAIKNQKPIPFGVIYPKKYNEYNQHAHSSMKSECIIAGNDDLSLNISVRFLHLIKIKADKQNTKENVQDEAECDWQTIEREINSGDLKVSELIKNKKTIQISFDKLNEDNNDEIKVNYINSVSEISGKVVIEASFVKNVENIFRITVSVSNDSLLENAEKITRDEALPQSFLSTHIILNAIDGEFISSQNPTENFTSVVSQCENIGTWPILVDESNTTMLSSPIILYDYPKINPQSKGDLFDSLEIEEALMLHFAVMSDDEKNRIAKSDEKLRAMINKVSNVTPEELINLHGGMYEK